MDAFLPLLNLYRLDVGPFDVTVITGAAPRQHNNRRVWRSLDTPGDPVLAFARQEGLLMEQRWCGNGSLVDPARANSPVSNEWGPLWTATTREAAVQGLGNAVRAAPAQMAAKVRAVSAGAWTQAAAAVPVSAASVVRGWSGA